MINKIKLMTLTSAVAFLTACTHGSVSNIPLEIQGLGTVYRYQGRANFSHQIAEADKLMIEHCLSVNGGKPVVVDLQKRDLGMAVFNSGSSNTTFNGTVTGSHNQAYVYGSANTSSMGSASALRNMNQEILYKCVKN
jgi:hypothetical protein